MSKSEPGKVVLVEHAIRHLSSHSLDFFVLVILIVFIMSFGPQKSLVLHLEEIDLVKANWDINESKVCGGLSVLVKS